MKKKPLVIILRHLDTEAKIQMGFTSPKEAIERLKSELPELQQITYVVEEQENRILMTINNSTWLNTQ